MLLLHPQSKPVFTVYAVCLQKAVHEAEFHCLNWAMKSQKAILQGHLDYSNGKKKKKRGYVTEDSSKKQFTLNLTFTLTYF